MLTSSWGHSNHLGNLALKVLKMHTLDLLEGISELKSLAVVDIGGLQVSSGRRQGEAIPSPHPGRSRYRRGWDDELNYFSDRSWPFTDGMVSGESPFA